MLDATPTPPATGGGEPPWLTIILAVIAAVVTLGGGYLTYLSTRSRTGNPPQTGESRGTPAPAPPGEPVGEPVERYDARMALIDRMVREQDERLDRLEEDNRRLSRELGEARAERDRLWWHLQSMPPTTGPPGWGPPAPGPVG